LKRTFIVSLCEFFNVIVQFANFYLWGSVFGARAEMDAFQTSIALPMVLVLVTTGPLISSLVPLLVEAHGKNTAFDLKGFKNNLINLFAAGGLLLAAVLFAVSGLVVRLIAPGLNQGMRLLATQLLRIEVLAIPLLIVGGVLTSFFYAEEKFYRPTIAPFFGGLAAMMLIIFCHRALGIHALAWGIVLNALVQLLFLLGIIREHSWRLDWKGPEVRKLVRKMLPLSGGNIYYKSDSLVDRFILSFLPTGSISYLAYGQRVTAVIGQVLNRGLVTTRFTELATKNLHDREGFKECLNRLFNRACFVIMPIIACLLLFVEPFLRIVFQRGAFSAADVRRIAVVIIAFLGVLLGGLLGSVLANTFYALGDTKTITLIGISVFSVGIFLKIAGVLVFSYVGVALATSIYFILGVLVEMVVLQKKIKLFSWKNTGVPLLKIIPPILGALAAGLTYKKLFRIGIFSLLGGVALVIMVYILLSWFCGVLKKDDLPAFLHRRFR
jgi:putative peptidoglycan lipid II flippase